MALSTPMELNGQSYAQITRISKDDFIILDSANDEALKSSPEERFVIDLGY